MNVRKQNDSVRWIAETAERRDLLNAVDNSATLSSTSRHCSVLLRFCFFCFCFFCLHDLHGYFFACLVLSLILYFYVSRFASLKPCLVDIISTRLLV